MTDEKQAVPVAQEQERARRILRDTISKQTLRPEGFYDDGRSMSLTSLVAVEAMMAFSESASLPCKSGEGAEIKPHVVTFLEAVRACPGCKHPVESYYDAALGDDIPQEASWQIAENAGWVICNGSHKWTLTASGREALVRHEYAALSTPSEQFAKSSPDAEVERILGLSDEEILAEADVSDLAWARGFKLGMRAGKSATSSPDAAGSGGEARTQGGEIVAWRERDGDEWAYYDADSDTGKHIAAHQRDRHNVSIFPLFAALTHDPLADAAKPIDATQTREAELVALVTEMASFAGPEPRFIERCRVFLAALNGRGGA